MLKKSIPTIIIALCTSAALIGFAFVQRYGEETHVSEAMLYVAAAIICVSPVIYRLLRCRIRVARPDVG